MPSKYSESTKTELEIDSLEREKRDPESLLIVVIAVLIIGYAIYRLLSSHLAQSIPNRPRRSIACSVTRSLHVAQLSSRSSHPRRVILRPHRRHSSFSTPSSVRNSNDLLITRKSWNPSQHRSLPHSVSRLVTISVSYRGSKTSQPSPASMSRPSQGD